MKKWTLIAYALLACGILYYVEQGVGVTYAIKAGLKGILFIGVPLGYFIFWRKQSFKRFLGLDHISRDTIVKGIVIGVGAFVGMVLLATVFSPMINFSDIRQELADKLHVTAGTYLAVGMYIIFINSLFEELFFRGIVFLKLEELGHRKHAMVFSSVLFGVYHMAMFRTWFPPMLVALCVGGLICVGLLFNWINSQSKTFINSWIVHILADLGIIIIGYKMLYM